MAMYPISERTRAEHECSITIHKAELARLRDRPGHANRTLAAWLQVTIDLEEKIVHLMKKTAGES